MRAVRLLSVATLVASPVLLPLMSAAPAAHAAAGSTPAWTTAVTLDGGGAEPSIRVPSDGKTAAYISAPTGAGSNFWRIDESTDSGGFTHLTPSKGVQPDLGTGGGDSEISVGQQPDPTTGCDPIAYSGLHNIDALDNFTTAVSTDCGQTFSLANPYATQNTLTDRQWQTFDGKLTNHLLYHKVDTGQIVDSVSYDGGKTYLTLGTPAGATGVVDAAHAYTIQNVKIGNVITDTTRPVAGQTYPVNGEQVHTLWATFAGSRDAADAAQGVVGSNAPGGTVPGTWDHMDTIYVARSDDGGLTWTDVTSYATGTDETRELDLIFPVLAEDTAGNLYSAWTDGNLIQYVVSGDAGKTWSKPYTVNPGEAGAKATGGTADVFPWVAAGGPGRLDVVWYHGAGGDTTGYRNVGTKDTAWTVAFAQLSNAAATDDTHTATPTVVTRDLAITPVMHKGNVCNNGTVCGITDGGTGDRTLLDFFQVAIDRAGRANIAYADDASSPGTSHVEYTRQNSGQSVNDGQPITPSVFADTQTCDANGTYTDPEGDATGALVDSTPRPSDDALDILRGWVTTDETTKEVVLHVKVKDLEDAPPAGSAPGSDGEFFDINFAYGGLTYDFVAQRSVANGESYELDYQGTTGRETIESGLHGSFNGTTDEVTARVPFTPPAGSDPRAPKLSDGVTLTGLASTSRRDEVLVVPNADAASGTCPYVVGAGSAPGTDVPQVPVAVLAPLAAIGALVGVGLLRRRRTATVTAG